MQADQGGRQRLEVQSSPDVHGSTVEPVRVQHGSPALPQL
jgi:hypothetical protein